MFIAVVNCIVIIHAVVCGSSSPSHRRMRMAMNNDIDKNKRIIDPADIGSLFKTKPAETECTEIKNEDFDDTVGLTDENKSIFSRDDGNMKDSDNDDKSVVSKLMPFSDDFFDLDIALDNRLRAAALEEIGMKKSSFIRSPSLSSGNETYGRTFQYDATAKGVRKDPMAFGAYRRSQVIENESTKSSNNKPKRSQPVQKRDTKYYDRLANREANKQKKREDVSRGDRPKIGDGKRDGKRKDSFYDAIKELGSGPVAKGSPTGTGVAEPPRNMKPVQLNKPQVFRRPARKVITPAEISNLFKPKEPVKSGSTSNRNDDDNDLDMVQDNDDDENWDNFDDSDQDRDTDEIADATLPSYTKPALPVSVQSMLDSKASLINGKTSSEFNPMVDPSTGDIPKWLTDAQKSADQRKRRGGKAIRKKKKLTDDWRFWGALITGAGFASAFYSIYQQTGGFGGGDGAGSMAETTSDIFGSGDPAGAAAAIDSGAGMFGTFSDTNGSPSGGGDELVI